MTTRGALALLLGALAISSCERRDLGVDFEANGTAENVQLSAVGHRGLFNAFDDPLSIASVVVWPKDSQELAWQARSLRCTTDATQIRYGVVPSGFEQMMNPQPLREHVTYAVRIDTCDHRSTGGYFDIANGNVELVWFLEQVR